MLAKLRLFVLQLNVGEMGDGVFRIKVVLVRTGPGVKCVEYEHIVLIGTKHPNSDVEFSILEKKRLFQIFLYYPILP